VKIGRSLLLLGTAFALGCAPSASHFESLSPAASRLDSLEASPAETATDASESEPALTDIPPPIAIPKTRLSVFGDVATDPVGQLTFRRVEEIRNAENEMYGWLIWVGPLDEPVRWTETLTAPIGVELPRDAHVGISQDGRRAVFNGAMVPDRGFIHSEWRLGANEAPGRYEIAVSLPDGREEGFSFVLGSPQESCPAMKVLLNWWRAKHSLAGDPENRDVSDRVLKVFGTRLTRHGFAIADLEDAYWYVIASAARRSDDRSVAYGHIVMRAIADFQGKARRYSSTTTNLTGLVDFGILFEAETSRLDESIRSLADRFAAVLTPHARSACADWWSGQREEEARLEGIRKQLEDEIVRVRERRAEREKRLELEVSP